VYRAKYFLVFATALSAGATIMIFFGWLSSLLEQNWAMVVLGIIALPTSGASLLYYVRSLMFPKPLATFSTFGITNTEGYFLPWSDVTKAYKWTGVLFVKDTTGSGWFLRIDPFEVGGNQLKDAIRLIHEYAPIEATTELPS